MPCSGSRRRRPPAGKNAGKVYFVSQTGIAPPTFVCMCNDPKAFPKNYRRFLSGSCASRCHLHGTPVRFVFRARRQREAERWTGGSGRGTHFVSIFFAGHFGSRVVLRRCRTGRTFTASGRTGRAWSRDALGRRAECETKRLVYVKN